MKLMMDILYQNGTERLYEIPQNMKLSEKDIINAVRSLGEDLYNRFSDSEDCSFKIYDENSFRVINMRKVSEVNFFTVE